MSDEDDQVTVTAHVDSDAPPDVLRALTDVAKAMASSASAHDKKAQQ